MIIYLARNTVNGKCYVGQTVRALNKRMKDHKAEAHSIRSRYSILHKAIVKYGWENFAWEVLEEAVDHNDLDMAERKWIEIYGSMVPGGYNLETGGSGTKVRSAETRSKIGAAHRGRTLSEDHRRKISDGCIGRVNSPEAREKMSRSQQGRKHSEDTKRKMSKNNAHNRGGAKLDWDKVTAIRELCKAGESRKSVAATYDIDVSQVCMIVNDKCWPELERPSV